MPVAVLAGLLAFALYNVALNYGQLSASAGVASLIIASIPLFTALLAVGFLGEHLGARGWSGIAVEEASASTPGSCSSLWLPSNLVSREPGFGISP